MSDLVIIGILAYSCHRVGHNFGDKMSKFCYTPSVMWRVMRLLSHGS